VKPLALAIALLGAAPAFALQFEFDNGLKASVDTTLTYGIAMRADDRDPALIGIANGGTSRSVNEDDGDLNFNKNKAFANVIKATTDVELKWRNFGFFGRGLAFYDFDLHDSNKLGPTGRDRLGKGVVGLDGFVSAAFDPMGHTLRMRAGRQVISWGESTFIGNGINVINPIDVSKLRIPGSELKEGLIPTTGIWSSLELSRASTSPTGTRRASTRAVPTSRTTTRSPTMRIARSSLSAGARTSTSRRRTRFRSPRPAPAVPRKRSTAPSIRPLRSGRRARRTATRATAANTASHSAISRTSSTTQSSACTT